MVKGSQTSIDTDAQDILPNKNTLPSNKRVLHLSNSQDNDDAWSKSMEHTLQYCRHTFSPETWGKVRGTMMRVCSEDGTKESDTPRDVSSREKKQSRGRKQRSRDLKAVKELLRSREHGKKERRRFESLTIHR